MDKDSRGKEVYLGLATVRVSGRQRPRATNRNSILPNSISASTTSMTQSTTTSGNKGDGGGGGSETGESLKSPLNEANNNLLMEGTSGASDNGLNNGVVNEVNIKESITKMKPTTTVNCKKKRQHRRLGGGIAKNQDDGKILIFWDFLDFRSIN